MALHIHIDPIGGMAGDMFLGALIDLGVDAGAVEQSLARAGMEGRFHLTTRRVLRQGIGAIDLQVQCAGRTTIEEHSEHTGDHPHRDGAVGHSHSTHQGHVHTHAQAHDHGRPGRAAAAPPAPAEQIQHQRHQHEHQHEHAHRGDILAIVDRLEVAERARERATRIINMLAEAEAMVHRMSPDQVHFHEVGAVDSIVDMLGAAVGLEMLGVESLTCGPLPIGRGFVQCAHGRMPLPAPATAYLLRGLATVGVDRTVETVTPTGAAIVAALAQPGAGAPPAMKLRAVGYGAGDRDDADVAN